MKAFVVSLAKSPRRDRIVAQLKSTSLEVHLIDAFDARDHESIEELISPAAQRLMHARYGREISKNEICTVRSHLAALEHIAAEDGDDRALVLEDDAQLMHPLPPSEVTAAARADIVIAGYTKVAPQAIPFLDLRNPFIRSQRFGPWSLVERYHNRTPGAVAYFVTPAVAARMARLVERDGSPTWLADDWGFYERSGLTLEHLHPPLFLENDWGMSYIEAARRSTGLTNVDERPRLILARRVLSVARKAAIRLRRLHIPQIP